MPTPRGLPYLGLEHASGTSLDLLHTLSTRGIFRKYELVLDLDGGLGGTSRWLAQRLGCEVVGTATNGREAAAATDLARRARLSTHVRSVAAEPAALPFQPSRFTHVWIVETLPRLERPEGALAEAARVLRHGGMLAIQDLVLADAESAPTIAGWQFATTAERMASLDRLGFADTQVHDRTSEASERSATVIAARERLLEVLGTAAPRLAEERMAITAALAAGKLRVVHLLARRV